MAMNCHVCVSIPMLFVVNSLFRRSYLNENLFVCCSCDGTSFINYHKERISFFTAVIKHNLITGIYQ